MNELRRVIICASFLCAVRGASWYAETNVPLGDNRSDPIISTTHGYLRGRWLSSSHDKTYAAFKGVPYAVPPLGDLRFEPPQEAEPWTGVRDALNHGAQCPQFLFVFNEYTGHEDCLHLNIYTPQRRDSQVTLFPVLLFIHGGSWVLGAGDMDDYLYGPDRFMDEEVVLVTINYRLGALGFLYLGNTIPGNMGLKDQAMALRWVKANARFFGGDPNRIVLMGESAGAASVEYQAINEESRGMISGVIAQSGSVLSAWAWTRPKVLARRTRLLARLVKCPNARSPVSIVRCLKTADPRTIVLYQILTNWSPEQIPIGVSFTPTAEPIGTPNAFLQDCPRNELARMTFDGRRSVPYLTGYTTAEGRFMINSAVKFIDSTVNHFVRWSLRLREKSMAFSGMHYFGGIRPSVFDDVIGDYEFKAPVIQSSRIHADAGFDVYLYHFTFVGSISYGRVMFNLNVATHTDDLAYLFQSRGLFGTPRIEAHESSPEAIVSKRLIRMWTNFAKTGNPTPSNATGIDVRWPLGPSRLLVIGKDFSIGKSELKSAWKRFLDLQCVS